MPSPTIRLFCVNVFVGNAALGVPQQVSDKLRTAKGSPYKNFQFYNVKREEIQVKTKIFMQVH